MILQQRPSQDPPISLLINLLRIIHDEQFSAWWEQKPEPPACISLLEPLNKCGWVSITDEEIIRLSIQWEADNKIDFRLAGKQRVLYLPPLKKNSEFFPIMWMNWDFTTNCGCIRIMMFKKKSDPEYELYPKHESKFWGIGYRFESPHSNCGNNADENDGEECNDGVHDFFHAQLIKDFRGGGTVFFDVVDWLPVTQPSFPVLANNPYTLMLSLFLTLYGKNYLKTLLIKHRDNLKNGKVFFNAYMELLQQ